MKINSDTKVSDIIKENPESIEVIASINRHFLKLKNPLLRKVLAPRVSIADAAKIGGTTVDVFLKKLSEIGFEIESIDQDTETNNYVDNGFSKKDIHENKMITIDVRPVIEAGSDPFKQIIERIKSLKEDEILQIINIFEPVPLINHLKALGFEAFTERPESDVVHTYFRKGDGVQENTFSVTEQTDLSEFESEKEAFGKKLITIDVRNLEMPEPMVEILREIEKLPEGYALFVHHKRMPQFLLPELKKREFNVLHHELDSENVNLLIYK